MTTDDGGEERRETLAWTTALAQEAGEMAATLVQREWKVNRKSDGTVVTDVDQAIERFVRGRINARFPHHAILGEEYGLEAQAEGAPIWAIDPIDGTTNLANRLPQWGVSIGLIEDGEPTVGALSFPLLGEQFAAARGLGATRNGERLPPLADGGPMTWDDTYAVCSYSARRIDFEPVPVRLRILGSAALELCWTAAGRVRGCQSIGVSLWDVAAGICVAREVGADAYWLRADEPWTATDMLQNGKREEDVLVTAPPATRAYLRNRLHFTR
jgi:myo-inositol-1(or 4)-monophosphatase